MADWYVYILRCADRSLYTGTTTDIDARVRTHNTGKGAKYTRGRRPVVLVYREAVDGRGAALKREHALRRLTAAAKRRLVQSRRRPKA
jgi:predicted GIY-YIG superfamily endonuclease